MAASLGRKLVFIGLGVTVCAKAAVSLPLLPRPNPEDTAPAVQEVVALPATPDLILAADSGKDEDAAPAENPPPLVEGLGRSTKVCEAPEEIMQALMEERALVEEQRASLETQLAEVALAREKLSIEKAALIGLKGEIESLLAKVDAAQTDDLNRLISFYQNMKPADAARIMDDMDIETTIMILGTMKPRVAAPILAKMSPVRTRAVSKIILERSQLPGDQDLTGIRLN